MDFQISLETMTASFGREYTTTHLGILDLPGVKYNIGHHVFKVNDYNIGPTI